MMREINSIKEILLLEQEILNNLIQEFKTAEELYQTSEKELSSKQKNIAQLNAIDQQKQQSMRTFCSKLRSEWRSKELELMKLKTLNHEN